MFTKKLVLNSPHELEIGDVIIGARPNFFADANWTKWKRHTVEEGFRIGYGKPRLILSHEHCQFLVERAYFDEPIMKYVKGQGWVYE
jgi:hypothetical protein